MKRQIMKSSRVRPLLLVAGGLAVLAVLYGMITILSWSTLTSVSERDFSAVRQQIRTAVDQPGMAIAERRGLHESAAQEIEHSCAVPAIVRWQSGVSKRLQRQLDECTSTKQRIQAALTAHQQLTRQYETEQYFATQVRRADQAARKLAATDSRAQRNTWQEAHSAITNHTTPQNMQPIQQQLLASIDGIMQAWNSAEQSKNYTQVSAAYTTLANVQRATDSMHAEAQADFNRTAEAASRDS